MKNSLETAMLKHFKMVFVLIIEGIGDPATNTHDLVVISSAILEKGAIISLEGVPAAGKDFGFGYKYDVLIEDAVLVK